MKVIHKRDLLAFALLLCAVPGSAQQDQAPKNEASQSQNPETSTPASEPQSSSPVQQDQPPAVNESSPAPVEETPSATKPHSETHKPPVSRKTSSTSQKRRNKQSTQNPKPVVHQSEGGAGAQTGKVVVRNGGATDGLIQLSPGGSQEQELHNRENTAQLLATTDENLKRISGRQLTASEQSTFDQIQSYVRQARSASDTGDLARAHTLAFKAHLLSDDLAKR